MYAVMFGTTACVEVLVAAKAALDIKTVRYARLFACHVPLTLCLSAHYDVIVFVIPVRLIFPLVIGVIKCIEVIRIVRVIVVIILEGQFEMLVLLSLVMESIVWESMV